MRKKARELPLDKKVTPDKNTKDHSLSNSRYSFSDLVDIDRLREIFKRFSKATGFTTGLVSYPEQELLIGTGWRDICTKFHRACPLSETHCKQSNIELTSKLNVLEELNIRPCENGLVDGATPIIVDGAHLASLFTGQILFEKPDIKRFKKQAEDYGYDLEAYLESLNDVPVVSEDKFLNAMVFLSDIAVMLAESGLRKLRFLEIEKESARAEKALLESEEKFRSLTYNLNIGLFRNTTGPEGEFIEANPAIVNMFGFDSKDEFLNIKVNDLYKYPHERKAFNDKLIREGKVKNKELELEKKGGIPFIASVSAVAVKDETGAVKYFDGVIEDITKRKHAEAALIESEEKYRTVLEANPDPVIVYDMEGRVIYFNPAFTNVFGWSLDERFGKKMDLFVPQEAWPETKMMINRVKEGKRFSAIRTIRYDKKGKIIHVSLSGATYKDDKGHLIGSIINLRNISHEKEMEAQLQQAQKMEAIGTLAGGIAHDFNNILSSILGYTELALLELPSETTIRNKLEAIQTSGERARDLVGQILAFSRREEHVRTPVKLDLIIRDALKLLRPAIPTTIDIQTQISSKCRIIGDPSRVHQIILNLCTNAYQAMLETGGILNIALARVEMKNKVDRFAQIPDGVYGKLTVSDTGTGIPTENIDRIFEPYFTTKEKGKGTGLGLAAVHGIVKSHGGAILVESKIGQGTTFEVYLPLTREIDDREKANPSQLLGGNERILLVDDEPDVLTVEKEMLEKLGYSLKAAGNALEAMKLLSEQPDQLDLVITDMTMPVMTGDKFADECRKINPGIPIILCTGFSDLISKEKAESLGINGFLTKPVLFSDISKMVRKVLDDAKK